jgi:hypothetical protein
VRTKLTRVLEATVNGPSGQVPGARLVHGLKRDQRFNGVTGGTTAIFHAPTAFAQQHLDWSENRTSGGQAAAAGGAERRRLLGMGGLAGLADGQFAGFRVGAEGFDGDLVAEAF